MWGVRMARASFLRPYLGLLALFLIVSCASDPSDHATTLKNVGPGVVIALGHEVSDFDTWKTGFDSRDALRAEFGLEIQSVLVGEDDLQVVWVIASAPSQEAAEAYLNDIGTARTMEADGVIGEVYRAVLDLGYTSSIDPDLYPDRLIVQHAVKDFEKWKSVFDGHIASRERAGVVDLFVSHPVGDSTDVHMMFGIVNPQETMDYMTSDALRIAMKLSGVVGEPRAYFVRASK